MGQWLFLHSCHNRYMLFFSPQRVKYLIIRFHWDTFFLLGNRRKPWHGFDWVVVLEFCCERRHLGTYFFVYPFILCVVRHSEDKLILTIAARRKWEDSETCLFSLRQQLQHSTNQLAKETNELLKELGSLPLPLSTSEQVGIFWFLVLFFNKKGICFNGSTVCETKITWPLVLDRPSLNRNLIISKMGVCGHCDKKKNVCTRSRKVPGI